MARLKDCTTPEERKKTGLEFFKLLRAGRYQRVRNIAAELDAWPPDSRLAWITERTGSKVDKLTMYEFLTNDQHPAAHLRQSFIEEMITRLRAMGYSPAAWEKRRAGEVQ